MFIFQMRTANSMFWEKEVFRLIEIKELPEETNSGILDSLLIADCEFVLTQSFSCLPRRQSLNSIRVAEKDYARLLMMPINKEKTCLKLEMSW